MTAPPLLPDFYAPRHFAEIDSTNDAAKRLAAEGAGEGLVVWADRQTAGRGRQGRVWHSPPGNLPCSILLRPECRPAEAAQLSFAAALAVCDALAPWRPRCKWPNDVLIEGRKIAGILLESEATGARVAWVVVGIGVNLAHHPAETETPAISLAELGATMTPGAMLASLCTHMLDWYRTWRQFGFAPLRQAWLDRAEGLGSEIRVRYARTETRGRFVDLDASGALVLENSEGTSHIAAGAVFPAA